MLKKTDSKPFWTSINTVPHKYPWLDEDIDCEIAVIGCGITAALCSLQFAKAGYETVMVGASPVGFGGTSLSSGIMSIDGEQSISHLVSRIGSDRAMMAIDELKRSVEEIEQLCSEFPDNCGFKRMDSLRYTVDKKEAECVCQEYSLRLHNGIQAELLDKQTACEQFSFFMNAGIYSQDMGAQMDPYRFVHMVTDAAAQAGARIYENTSITVLDNSYDSKIILESRWGHHINAQYVIVAAGLETQRECGGIAKSSTVYTLVTEPLAEFPGWRGPCIIHNEDVPQIYLTVTPDNRILIGGLGSSLMNEQGKLAGLLDMTPLAEKRYEQLENKLREMFPAIRNITVEYMYAARAGKTQDGLPVLGRLPDENRVAYALCCGDDGLLYAEMASRLLLEQYQGKNNQQLGLYSPNRKWRLKH